MMTTAEGSAELGLPLEAAYRLITDFASYPVFLAGVDSVRRVGDGRLEWVGSLGGRRRSWRATITEPAPDTSVAWTSTGGPSHSGVVALEPLAADRTQLRASFLAVRTAPLEPPHLVPVEPLDVTELWRGVTLAVDADGLRALPTVEPGTDPTEAARARARAALGAGETAG
jgi:hypothetical protein